MTHSWNSICACGRNIFVNKRVFARSARGFSLRPRLRVHIEIYLYIEGLPGVRKPEYLEQLRFF